MRPGRWICLCVTAGVLLAASAMGGENLVRNGDFADGLKHWQTVWEGTDYYGDKNAQHISLVDDPLGEKKGKVLCFDIPPKVAAVQGVSAVTVMIEVEPYAVYEFGCDLYSTRPDMKIFAEGYRENPEQTNANYFEIRGYERFYRAVIHPKGAIGKWTSQKKVIDLSKKAARYQPTHIQIKVYAYYPAGQVYWTNVYLKQLKPPPADTVEKKESN